MTRGEGEPSLVGSWSRRPDRNCIISWSRMLRDLSSWCTTIWGIPVPRLSAQMTHTAVLRDRWLENNTFLPITTLQCAYRGSEHVGALLDHHQILALYLGKEATREGDWFIALSGRHIRAFPLIDSLPIAIHSGHPGGMCGNSHPFSRRRPQSIGRGSEAIFSSRYGHKIRPLKLGAENPCARLPGKKVTSVCYPWNKFGILVGIFYC